MNQPSLPGIPRGRSRDEVSAAAAPPPTSPPSPLEQRQARSAQARDRRKSLFSRSRDFDTENEIPVSHFGVQHGVVPTWASFHGSAKSAWRKYGEEKEVPIVGIHSPQSEVQANRFREAVERPETRSNPRFGGMSGDLPRVFHETAPGRLEMTGANSARRGPTQHRYTVVDGNHRVTSALAQGQMLQPARVLEPKHEMAVTEHTERVHEHKANAFARTMVDPGEAMWDKEPDWPTQSGGAMGEATAKRMGLLRS